MSTNFSITWYDVLVIGLSPSPNYIVYFTPSGTQGLKRHMLSTYLFWCHVPLRYVFDYHPGEVYWCTADIGWITGHSYITYGPLANGATSVLVCQLSTSFRVNLEKMALDDWRLPDHLGITPNIIFSNCVQYFIRVTVVVDKKNACICNLSTSVSKINWVGLYYIQHLMTNNNMVCC